MVLRSFLVLSLLLGASFAEVPDATVAKYVSLGVMPKKVAAVFHDKTIQRRLLFSIDVPGPVFGSMFDDLEFAVDKAVQYAGKPYKIKKVDEHYDAHDGARTKVDIHPLKLDPKGGKFVYYIEGEYSAALKLKGTMIMDVSYEERNGNTYFFIDAFISIDDPFLRGMANAFMNFKGFKAFTDNVIDGTIQDVRRAGFTVARNVWEKEWNRSRTAPLRK